MQKRIIAIILVLISWKGISSGQTVRFVDSLIELSQDAPDSLLPELYQRIAWDAQRVDPVVGLQYSLKAVDAALEQQNEYYIVRAYSTLAANELNRELYNDALGHYKVSLQYAMQFGMKDQVAFVYNNLARLFICMGDYKTAESYGYTAMENANRLGDLEIKSFAHYNLGIIYRNLKKYDLAAKHLKHSYFIRHDSLAGDIRCFAPLEALVQLYIMESDYAAARSLISQAAGDTAINYTQEIRSEIWLQLAQLYYKMGQLDSAESASAIALQEARKCGYVQRIKNNYWLADSIYQKKRDFKNASAVIRDFIQISDTLFNVELAEQLSKIRFSSKYVRNEKTLEDSKQQRKTLYIVLPISLLALIVGIWGITRIVSTNRKIRSLNTDMDNIHTSILGSLKYARNIQDAVRPDFSNFGTSFSDKFLIYKPRDIVSGDFYWRHSDGRYEMIAVADCTGHSVPGAMLTMLGTTALQEIAISGVRKSSDVLELLRDKIKFMMEQNELNPMQDGMDISLVVVDNETRTLDYAGAFCGLIFIRDGELSTIKATRAPIGQYFKEIKFESRIIELRPGDRIYLMTDGYCSQFGGDRGRKFHEKNFREMLLANHLRPMSEQKQVLEREFLAWKGNNIQVDDVTVAGFMFG